MRVWKTYVLIVADMEPQPTAALVVILPRSQSL
ncbi:hypothetical protein LINGRAHAP2_LOCUS15240 [Linum grandiflorum]